MGIRENICGLSKVSALKVLGSMGAGPKAVHATLIKMGFQPQYGTCAVNTAIGRREGYELPTLTPAQKKELKAIADACIEWTKGNGPDPVANKRGAPKAEKAAPVKKATSVPPAAKKGAASVSPSPKASAPKGAPGAKASGAPKPTPKAKAKPANLPAGAEVIK